MPISKYIVPEGLDVGMDAVSMVGDSKSGFNKQALKKRKASMEFSDIEFPRKPGYAYLHIITTGAEDTYGPNANGDAWTWDYKTVHAPEPKDKDHVSLRLDGGLKKYHNEGFEKHSDVFKEHVTKRQGAEPSGYIVKAAVNEPMRRGELIIGVDTNKWAKELQKKASGGNIFFSIGCDVPKDTCGICLNQATKRSEYCDHVKNHLLELTKKGPRVFTYNDAPKFYDISGVANPADAIAFALRSMDTIDKSASLHIPALNGAPLTKEAVYKKLAVISKRIPAMAMDDPLVEACSCDHEAEDCLLKKVMGMYDTREILDGLNRKGILLSPEGFFKLVSEDVDTDTLKDTLLSIKDEDLDLKDIFDTILNSEEDLEDESYDVQEVPDMGMLNIIDRFVPMLSIHEDPVKVRSMSITIKVKKPNSKKAHLIKQASDVLSKEYGKYVASFVSSYRNNKEEMAIRKIASMST